MEETTLGGPLPRPGEAEPPLNVLNALEESKQRRSTGNDRLAQLFNMQRELAKAQGTPQFDFSKPLGHNAKKSLTEWAREFANCMIAEAQEFVDWFPWKHWSIQPGNKQLNPENLWTQEHLDQAREELIDQLHFLMESWLLLGGDADSFFEGYMAKHQVNIQRHESGTY